MFWIPLLQAENRAKEQYSSLTIYHGDLTRAYLDTLLARTQGDACAGESDVAIARVLSNNESDLPKRTECV